MNSCKQNILPGITCGPTLQNTASYFFQNTGSYFYHGNLTSLFVSVSFWDLWCLLDVSPNSCLAISCPDSRLITISRAIFVIDYREFRLIRFLIRMRLVIEVFDGALSALLGTVPIMAKLLKPLPGFWNSLTSNSEVSNDTHWSLPAWKRTIIAQYL